MDASTTAAEAGASATQAYVAAMAPSATARASPAGEGADGGADLLWTLAKVLALPAAVGVGAGLLFSYAMSLRTEPIEDKIEVVEDKTVYLLREIKEQRRVIADLRRTVHGLGAQTATLGRRLDVGAPKKHVRFHFNKAPENHNQLQFVKEGDSPGARCCDHSGGTIALANGANLVQINETAQYIISFAVGHAPGADGNAYVQLYTIPPGASEPSANEGLPTVYQSKSGHGQSSLAVPIFIEAGTRVGLRIVSGTVVHNTRLNWFMVQQL